MPKAVRLSDICTGHGCWPPRPNAGASPDVRANGRGAHRVADPWRPHTCPSIPETHASVQASGSPDVCVNGRPWARVGDAVACGSRNATGSPNVTLNGD